MDVESTRVRYLIYIDRSRSPTNFKAGAQRSDWKPHESQSLFHFSDLSQFTDAELFAV